MRKDIIIIDDDRDLCTLLQESLLQENICADISCNGFDGIKSVKDKEYQLVVLDVMMPGISGFEVLERIRDMSNVPILMLTAKDDSTSRSKMYNLVKDSSDYITVQCDIERALFATKMYGFTDNDCLCHGNLGNTEILLEYSKECNDEEVRHMMLSARTQIAMDIINENYDCARSYLHGYKIPGFMTGISGMGYSLLRDLYPELPCILALEI